MQINSSGGDGEGCVVVLPMFLLSPCRRSPHSTEVPMRLAPSAASHWFTMILGSYSQQSIATRTSQTFPAVFCPPNFFFARQAKERERTKKVALSLLPFSEQSISPHRPDCTPTRPKAIPICTPPFFTPRRSKKKFISDALLCVTFSFLYASLGSSPGLLSRFGGLRGAHFSHPRYPVIWCILVSLGCHLPGPASFDPTPTLGKVQEATRSQKGKRRSHAAVAF